MRKTFYSAIILLILTGCTDVSDYEDTIQTLESEVETLNGDLEQVNDEVMTLSTENDKLTKSNTSLENKYNKYKEKMEPYEELEESEAEARKLEAERIAQEEKEQEAAKKEEETLAKEKAEKEAAEKEAAEKKAAEEEEEKKITQGYETGITFDQLARNPDDYIAEKIKFTGKVVQVLEGTDENELRFAVDDDYDKMIYLAYSTDIVDQRVLEDDYLTIYGMSVGTISYESTLGATITIPAAMVDRIDFN